MLKSLILIVLLLSRIFSFGVAESSFYITETSGVANFLLGENTSSEFDELPHFLVNFDNVD
jgi:hypothetical protein